MIALLLGIIIMLGVTQIATSNSNTRYELDRSGRQIENATFALRELENDLTNAAFWGEKGAESPGTIPPVCADEIVELKQAMGYPVQGGQNPDAAFDCTATTPKAGTNYLSIRRANSCATLDPAGCEPAGDNYHIKVHACFNESSTDKPGDFDIFSASEVSSLAYKQRDCDTDAPEYRFLNRIYYINDDDQLVRAELVGKTYEETPLVDGVEWMRFQYGMDRNGDGQVDDDVNANTLDPTYDLATDTPDAFPNDWADVVSVRISLVVRNTGEGGESTGESAGFVDDKDYTVAGEPYTVPAEFQGHRRQVYTRTVSLRNVAGRRQVE